MGFEDPFALKQSDAQSAFLRGPERLEQRPELFRFDAGPGVGDRDHHEPIHLLGRNPDRAARCPSMRPVRSDGLPRIQWCRSAFVSPVVRTCELQDTSGYLNTMISMDKLLVPNVSITTTKRM